MKRFRNFSIMLLMVLATSCIKERFDSCSTNLIFRYFGDGTKDLFSEKIKKVDLYVYNESGTLVEGITLDQESLTRHQGTSLNLPAGKYRVVGCGNAWSNTRIDDVSKLSTALLAAPQYFTKKQITTNDSLYIGTGDFEVLLGESSTDTLDFRSLHINMYFELEGVEEEALPDGGSPIEIKIDNVSPTVDFANKFSSESVSYSPPVRKKENTSGYLCTCNVLPFKNDNRIYIRLVKKDTKQTIYTLSLKEFMHNNKISVDGMNEVTIGIRFRFNGTSVTVQPWSEEVVKPGLR